MAIPTKPKRAPQIPKAEATARFITVVIELLDEEPIAAISDQLIADTAGINRATIYRHFGSRFELLDAVVAELTRRWLSTVTEILPVPESSWGGHGGEPMRARLNPMTQKIFQLAAYLTAGGHHSESLRTSFTLISDMWISSLESLGVPPRMARTLTFKTIGLNLARAAIVDLVDIPEETISDIEALSLVEIISHEESSAKLGW